MSAAAATPTRAREGSHWLDVVADPVRLQILRLLSQVTDATAAELAKRVLNSEVPTEPPTCCDVLTIADATPASFLGTPNVAVPKAGAKMMPMPTPRISSDGSTLPA